MRSGFGMGFVGALLLFALTAWPSPERLPLFELQNWDGRTITNEVFHGKTTIVVPTFAKCVFACPMITFLLTELDHELGSPGNVQYLHISVNPRDDTAEEIRLHFEKHDIDPSSDPRWLFANGPEEDIERFLARVGVEVERTAVAEGVVTEHTIRVFVVGPDGSTLRTFDTYFWNKEEMMHALRFALEASVSD